MRRRPDPAPVDPEARPVRKALKTSLESELETVDRLLRRTGASEEEIREALKAVLRMRDPDTPYGVSEGPERRRAAEEAKPYGER